MFSTPEASSKSSTESAQMALPPALTSAIESISVRHAGSAAGVYSTSRYFGSIVGSAILAGLIGVNRTNAGGFDMVFIVVAVSAFAAALAALFMVPRPDNQD